MEKKFKDFYIDHLDNFENKDEIKLMEDGKFKKFIKDSDDEDELDKELYVALDNEDDWEEDDNDLDDEEDEKKKDKDIKDETYYIRKDKEELEEEFNFYLNENNINEKERTRIERKKIRGKKEALRIATKGQFDNWDLRKKAMFIARYEYKELAPGKGRYIKRQSPKNVQDVFKQLKKKKKMMKKMMKTKGTMIAKKIKRIKARGEFKK